LDQTGSDSQNGVADQAILKGLQAFSPGLRGTSYPGKSSPNSHQL